jgi:uroporphyrinogen-III decarboxylase
MAPLGLISLGPHNIATDLAGDAIYWWMLEEPELYHELLCKITQGMILLEDFSRAVYPGKKGGVGIAEDAAQVISRDDFVKRVAPYDLMFYGRYGEIMNGVRGMHMCGNSSHLLDILADVLKITHFSLFGYMVDLDKIKDTMGGKVMLTGNINPMKMLQGTAADVREDCFKVMDKLAPCGGFMLSDGANVCPGAPLENINAVVEASELYCSEHPEILL